MIFVTVDELVGLVLDDIGLVTGSGVQQYTEPQIISNIWTSFVTLYRKRFWTHLTKTTQHNLDGVTGVVTDSNIGIKSPDDIEWVRYQPYESTDVFHRLHGREYISGSWYAWDPLDFDHVQYATKLVKIFPESLTGPIRIRARRLPTKFVNGTDIVPFDSIAMQHFVAANILAVDGTNPSAEQRLNTLFDQVYKDLITNQSNQVQYYGRPTATSFTVADTIP